ncbi:hypothetical protein [Cognatitamlana onchidii]|nr:hypothetical protein [Algibacter onchidii]
MKTKKKLASNKLLNPFLGFGWFTGTPSKRIEGEIKFQTFRSLKVAK